MTWRITMAVKLLIPNALQRYTGNQEEIEVSAGTVDQALSALAEKYPEIRKHLFSESGQLRQFVNVYVGSEDMRHLQGPATPLKDGDELSVVPSIAGGVSVLEPNEEKTVELGKDELLRYSRHI